MFFSFNYKQGNAVYLIFLSLVVIYVCDYFTQFSFICSLHLLLSFGVLKCSS